VLTKIPYVYDMRAIALPGDEWWQLLKWLIDLIF
jgi:hypothetical protein